MDHSPSSEPLLRVDDLRQYFPVTAGLFRRQVGVVKAVDGISFNLLPQQNLGLVGESGCGKTTLGRTILRLYKPTSGKIIFKDNDLTHMNSSALRKLRPKMQMIFQDPQDSLNPRMTVGSIIAEPIDEHKSINNRERARRVEELLEAVGLNPRYTNRYPHEFSGGQRQRIGIARALSLNPEFIVCDEPIAALDVSIQAQIINLLRDLQDRLHIAFLVIAHDLALVHQISDRIVVMYLGEAVEEGPSDDIVGRPQHPYTVALLSATPVPEVGGDTERIVLTGDPPSPINRPRGCRFHPRCPVVRDRCKGKKPPLVEFEPGRKVSCFYAGEMLPPRDLWEHERERLPGDTPV